MAEDDDDAGDEVKAFMRSGADGYVEYLDEVHRVAMRVPKEPLIRLRNTLTYLQEKDGTLFVVGNGGNATVAEHMALGMSLNCHREGRKGTRVMSLSGNGSVISAAANDFGMRQMFAAQLRVQARRGDVLLALSGSGDSENIAYAVETARSLGVASAVIVGKRGRVTEFADMVICLNAEHNAVVEDVAVMLLHWLYGSFMMAGARA